VVGGEDVKNDGLVSAAGLDLQRVDELAADAVTLVVGVYLDAFQVDLGWLVVESQ
jgi:hypothetical protein